MNTKRKLFTALLGLATLFGCFGACIFSNSNIYATEVNADGSGHYHNEIEFNAWSSNNSLPTSGSYYLTNDIEISYSKYSEYASVLNGDLNLCLNGHLIKMTYTSDWKGPSTFFVGSGKVLKLFDCNESEATMHYYRTSTENDWALSSYSASAKSLDEVTLNTPSGTIVKIPGGAIVDSCNNSSRREPCTYDNPYGGAIKVDGTNAQFYMYGGNIIGNYCNYGGGGVAIEHGASFEMNGGRIIGNNGHEGGGIYSRNNTCNLTINDGLIAFNIARNTYGGGIATLGPITMNSGSIIGNRTKPVSDNQNRSGGGVFSYGSTFKMNGGTISNNYSHNNGGGIFVAAGAKFIMDGGTISNNNANLCGGGINSEGAIEIKKGTISSNTCGQNGGGIQAYSGSIEMSGGTISNNTATLYGGGIENFVTFNMTGGSILNNTALNNGGGGIDNNGTVTIIDSTIKGNNCKDGIGYQIRCPKGWGYASLNGYCNADNTRNSDANYDLYYVSINTKTKLVLNKQGGTGGDDYVDVMYNQQIPELISVPTKTGYTFRFYGDGETVETLYYNSKGERTFPSICNKIVAEILLYARWNANTYSVTLDLQGGTGGITSITPTFDAKMPEITLPSNDYFEFGGYFTDINGDGTQYYNAEGTSARSWDMASDTTLYAYWIKTIENFSKEFLVKTTIGNYCDKTKGIDLDKSIKDDLFISFYMVNSDGKTAFKNAKWVRGHSQIYENDIVEAKSRYCYMVVELGINDFLNLFTEAELKALMHRGSIVSLFNDGEDGSSIILVASLSILAITTVSAYILFRKRKEE